MPETPTVSPTDLKRALDAARQARHMAYAPYSNFKVGAAVLAQDGQLYTGCNVEIASWEEATCAERTAIASAIAQGAVSERTDFIKLVAVSTQNSRPGVPLALGSPCGACRQVICDFCQPDNCVIIMDDGGDGASLTLETLLPHGFRLTRHIEKLPRISCEALERQALQNTHAGNLLEVARAMRSNAARQVQDMPEGAVILTTDGRAFAGASVENSCTALNMRALRCAVDRAVAAGAALKDAAFVKAAALSIPRRGCTFENSWRQAINPALVSEFFTGDADIFLQLGDAPAISLKVPELFAYIDKYAVRQT